jgi:predicted Ser/Thr protein kinase
MNPLNWIQKATDQNDTQSEILSFSDYMEIFEKNTKRECRPTYEFILDMLKYYGEHSDGSFKLFQTNHPDSPPVYGQAKVQQALLQNLVNFSEEGFNNKFILLIGPNGSSKSSLVKKLIKGLEDYSETDAGKLFSFSWIFPIENYVKGTLGLNTTVRDTNLVSYAYLEDKEISAIMPSELKDHPLLLIPREYRQELIDNALKGDDRLLESVRKSYLYRGDLSKRNRMIYDALLKNYKGKHQEVLKHIRVERFSISKRYSTGAVTIEPQIHVDARMQQITMDKRLASLPPSLQSLNLFSLQGEAVMANRGVLEYSDLLKRPLDAYKYLLMTMETGSINLQGILTELDIFFIGTSNEIHLAAFKQHPDFNSFKGRFNFVTVPYLLDVREEEKIYSDQVLGLKDRSQFSPHALNALCLFAVMSRLRVCQTKNYNDKKLANIATNLSPLEKALFLAGIELPEKLDIESKQILKHGLEEILSEYVNDSLYEGKFGLSPRDTKYIIYKLSSAHENVTFVEVLDILQNLILKKSEYDFLNMAPQADYHNPARYIEMIKEYNLNIFDRELRNSLGLVDERSYEDFIKRYVENINALIKGEKIKNTTTGKFVEPDDYFIKEFESSINLKEDPKTYRSLLISKLGAYFLDNPGKSILYTEVFPDLVDRLQESFRIEQKKVIMSISKNLVFFEAEFAKNVDPTKGTPLSDENRKQIKTVLKNLETRYGYTEGAAMSLLNFLIKEKY